MNKETEKQLALNLLAHKAKGYSTWSIIKKSKSRYCILFILLSLCFLAFFLGTDKNISLTFLFLAGLLSGTILRDIGWIRSIKQLWPFSFKVYNWEKIEKIAEIDKTLNKTDQITAEPSRNLE